MTRGMFCRVLYRAAGSPPVEQSNTFPDVQPDTWYGPAVEWAAGQDLVNGYEDGSFRALEPMTREQIAALLWRSAGSPAAEPGADYADEGEISPWASDAVNWARDHKVLTGFPENLFLPQALATRAQVLMNYTLLPGTKSVVSVIDVLCRPGGIAPLGDGGFLVTDAYHNVIWLVQGGASQASVEEFFPISPSGKMVYGYWLFVCDSFSRKVVTIALGTDGAA